MKKEKNYYYFFGIKLHDSLSFLFTLKLGLIISYNFIRLTNNNSQHYVITLYCGDL